METGLSLTAGDLNFNAPLLTLRGGDVGRGQGGLDPPTFKVGGAEPPISAKTPQNLYFHIL